MKTEPSTVARSLPSAPRHDVDRGAVAVDQVVDAAAAVDELGVLDRELACGGPDAAAAHLAGTHAGVVASEDAVGDAHVVGGGAVRVDQIDRPAFLLGGVPLEEARCNLQRTVRCEDGTAVPRVRPRRPVVVESVVVAERAVRELHGRRSDIGHEETASEGARDAVGGAIRRSAATLDREAVHDGVGRASQDVVAVVGVVVQRVDVAAERRRIRRPVALVARRHSARESAVELHAGLQREAVGAAGAGLVDAGGDPDLGIRRGGRHRDPQILVCVRPTRAVLQSCGGAVNVDN